MWTRKQLKDRAKNVLRTSYWKAFLASLLLGVVTGGLPSCSFNGGGSGKNQDFPFFSGNLGDEFDGFMYAILVGIIVVAIIVVLISIALRIFVCNPLEVGIRKYFTQSAREDVNMNYMGYGFSKGNYVVIMKAMLWRMFLNFLWYLLLIIPGIVKYYAYSMTPYLLADQPHLGTKRAVELSNRMTRGHKWRMFVLDLSFLGWYLLGTIALFIGVLFVLPYVNATQAELYLELRQRAMDDGIIDRSELE
ncbi:DUF975 family protein [Paenibacillus vulneris]|uniref:DUF975 family protein n=1 Tax=Paenibacillus vulneris TaxID=1133364 RepID=A0ABW3USK9_9BACL|nr:MULTISPECIES: DUF975 family protein [unclassified Paenibacillus]MBE1445133.1 hypothetical protein [Paenibacillus sp. OAS669]